MTQGIGGFGRKQTEPYPQRMEPMPLSPGPDSPEGTAELSVEELKERFLDQEKRRRDVIESGTADLAYSIDGNDMQVLHIDLEPGQNIIAEPSAMVWKDFDIEPAVQLGDLRQHGQGMAGKLYDAGKRLMTGESTYFVRFTHMGSGAPARIGLASRRPGRIIPIRLSDVGNTLICEKDAYIASGHGVAVEGTLLLTLDGIKNCDFVIGLAGGEGFWMQRLAGKGIAFLHAGGHVIERTLAPMQRIHVDTGCLVAFEGSVNYNVVATGGIRNSAIGGEGLFNASLTGPGKVWIQSLPYDRLMRNTAGDTGASNSVIENLSSASWGIKELSESDAVADGISSARDLLNRFL